MKIVILEIRFTCMYVCIYQIYIALISCSAHVHERFNNIVSKNYGASLVGS
jgi:hypothetical protein